MLAGLCCLFKYSMAELPMLLKTTVCLLLFVSALAWAAHPAAVSSFCAYSSLWGVSGEKWNPAGRLPDFSYAGYHAGEARIPNAPLSGISNEISTPRRRTHGRFRRTAQGNSVDQEGSAVHSSRHLRHREAHRHFERESGTARSGTRQNNPCFPPTL